jgi:hypothetical protein
MDLLFLILVYIVFLGVPLGLCFLALCCMIKYIKRA